MKKTNIFIIVGFLMTAVLSAEEPLAYKVTATSETYKQIRKRDGKYDITVITLQKGDIVYSNDARMNYKGDIDNYVFIMFLLKPNDGYGIHVKNLFPVNTEDVFGKEIIIDYPSELGDVKEMWVPAYYCYVLNSEDRETLLKFNSTLKELGGPGYWYENFQSDIENGRCMFYNAAIKIGNDTHLLVKNIKKTEYGYEVNCVESVSDYRREDEYPLTFYQPFQDTSEFWDKYNPGDEMTLYLYLDGDYMDIYVDGKDLHLGTLVKVKKEFIQEYQGLIRNNTCDLSRITSWPKRADGSMDYPPPASATNINNEETENDDYNAIMEFAKEKPVKTGSGFKIILIAGIAVLLGGGAAVFVIKKRK
jgi:LPXTG-motif cell wall-anchored protein